MSKTPMSAATAPIGGASLAADYRLNRRHGLTAELSLMDQASDGAARGPRYRAVRMTMGAVARF